MLNICISDWTSRTLHCVHTAYLCFSGYCYSKRRLFSSIILTGRGKRRTQLLDDHQERRGCRNLKQEALDGALWRNSLGRGNGAVVWQTALWMDNVHRLVQGGSNMTGTDLYVNKPHCTAAVRPWESETTPSALPSARVRTCSVLSGSC